MHKLDFQETIEACEVKVGTYSQTNEYMMFYDKPRSRSFIDTQIQQFQTSFPPKTLKPFETKFPVEPPWDVGMTICSNVQGLMTKMASRPIYGKKPSKISFFGTKRLMTLKLGIQHRVLRYYQIYSNDDTGLTLSIFMIWSNLFPNASAWVKAYSHQGLPVSLHLSDTWLYNKATLFKL